MCVGVGAQSNFPTRDHQNIFNLILSYIYILIFFENIGGGGYEAALGTTVSYLSFL